MKVNNSIPLKTHKIEITETLQRVIEVAAENESEALEKVREQYQNEEIVLDSGDMVDSCIEEQK